MLISESRAQLEMQLAEKTPNGIAGLPPSPGTVFDVFRQFAAVPATDAAPAQEDGDGVLAQFGPADHADTIAFMVDLTRQFIETSDENPAIWQLSCVFLWPESPPTSALGRGTLWSFDLSLDGFFAATAALPGWAWALATDQAPNHFAISFDRV
ncbi:hypothetical protein ACFRJ9_14650 [Paenarthrobacter sp. NPDC056912]|uniref:hypothetical protein n=1 Tax=Paenarthrobacter sp. NPDC056912 TaxID=3345965 RepID=UPI003671F4B0